MSFIRSGGRLVRGTRFVRRGGVLVEGRPAPYVPNLMSALIYSSPPWSFSLIAATPVEKFPDGTDRNRLYATGEASGYHSALRNFTVTAGLHKLSVKAQADTNHLMDGDLYTNGTTYFDWAGRTNLTTGTNSYGAVMTSLGGGVWLYEKTYTFPAGTTMMQVRLLLPSPSNDSSSYLAAGEAYFVGELTLAPA